MAPCISLKILFPGPLSCISARIDCSRVSLLFPAPPRLLPLMRLQAPRVIALLLIAQCCVTHSSAASTSPTLVSARIKHVVVVMEENRSFDHFFGFAKKLAGMAVDGLTGYESNPLNGSRAYSRRIAVDDQSPYLGPCDPDPSTSATTAKIFGVSNAAHGKLSRSHARMQEPDSGMIINR